MQKEKIDHKHLIEIILMSNRITRTKAGILYIIFLSTRMRLKGKGKAEIDMSHGKRYFLLQQHCVNH